MSAAPVASVAAVQKALGCEERTLDKHDVCMAHLGEDGMLVDWTDRGCPVAVAAADAAVEAATPGIQAGALREFGAKVLTEYEERTDRVGSYGQTKIRAALLTAGRMAEHEADRIEPRP